MLNFQLFCQLNILVKLMPNLSLGFLKSGHPGAHVPHFSCSGLQYSLHFTVSCERGCFPQSLRKPCSARGCHSCLLRRPVPSFDPSHQPTSPLTLQSPNGLA